MARPPNARAKHRLPATAIELPEAAGDADSPVVLTGERLTLWTDLRARYQLDVASEALLKNGVEALERAHSLAQQVARDGAVFKDRFGGLKPNPAILLERDFRGLASRTLSQLAARLEG
jgi:hypothetical protein